MDTMNRQFVGVCVVVVNQAARMREIAIQAQANSLLEQIEKSAKVGHFYVHLHVCSENVITLRHHGYNVRVLDETGFSKISW